MTKEEHDKKVKLLAEIAKKNRHRCSTHCPYWNREDRECKQFNVTHFPPHTCLAYLNYMLKNEEEGRTHKLDDYKNELK